MNFNQYVELRAIIEKEGQSINDVFRLNEAPATTPATPKPAPTAAQAPSATQSQPGPIANAAKTYTNFISKGADKLGSAAQLLTRSGRLKSKLNTIAQKTQKQLSDQVLKKYLPKILANEKAQIDKIIAGTKNVQNVEQKKKAVDTQMAAIRNAVNQQYEIVDQAVTKFILTSTTTVTNKITASKATDKNKMLLSNYWTLLSTQMAMNASMYIVKQRSQFIDTLYGDDQKAAEAAKALEFANVNKALAAKKAEAEKLKKTITQLSTALDAEKAAAPLVVTTGTQYTFTNDKGQAQTVTAADPKAHAVVQGKTYVIFPNKQEMAVDTAKLKPIAPAAPATPPPPPPPPPKKTTPPPPPPKKTV